MGFSNIGIGLALDGEKEFKKGISEVRSELRLLESQAKLTEAEYSGNANSLKALTEKHNIFTKQLEAEEKKVALNRAELERWQKVNQDAATRTEELKKRLSAAEEAMDKMKNSSDATTDEIDAQQKTIDELKDKLQNAERAYTTSEGKITKYQTSLNKAQTELVQMDQKVRENEKHLGEAERSTDGLAKSIDEYGAEVEEAKEKTSVFGDVLKAELAGEMIIGAVEKLANGITKIATTTVSTGASFEKAMGQVSATMGLTAEEIANGSREYGILAEAAEASGKATKYSASQAAEALNYLALAGYDAKKAAETLPAVLNLASAGGMELAYASDLVTDAMAALGMETSQLDNYIDEMTRTSQKSNTSIAQLGEATLITAGTVSMTKQSLETMNAELGVLANNGIKGAEGGTHLRNVLLRLVAPTNDGAAALKRLGVEVSDSNGNVRDLNDILVDLNKGLSGLSDTDKTNIISKIFKLTDLSAVNALLKGTGQEFDNLYNELLDCSDAAKNAAETMEANLTGKITILQSALEGLGITAYERIQGMLKDSVDAATDSVGRLQESMDNGELGRSFDDFSDALGDAADGAIDFAEDALPALIDGLTWVMDNADLVKAGITGIAAATIYHGTVAPMIASVTKAWNTYKQGTEGATVSQWLLNGAMNANPAGILITAIVGLTAALAVYSSTIESATAEAEEYLAQKKAMIEGERREAEERRKNRAETESSITAIDRMKKELLALNDQESLSAQQKTRLKEIVDQLNQAMPELNLAIDEQSGKLLESSDAAGHYIDNMKEMLMLSAAQEDIKNIAAEMYEAEKALAEMREDLKDATWKLKDVQIEYNEACAAAGGFATMVEGYDEYIADIDNLTLKQHGLKEAIVEQQEVCAGLEEEYQKAQKSVDSYTEAAEKSSEALGKTTGATVSYKNAVYEATQEVSGSAELIQQAYEEAKNKAAESIEKQVGLFDKLSTASDMTAKQMADNLQSQTDTYTTYAGNLARAADLMEQDTTGSFTEIVNAIMAMGMDGAGYLNELITSFEGGSEEFNRILANWAEMKESRELLTESLGDIQTGYTDQMDALLGIHTERTGKIQDDTEKKTTESLAFAKEKNKETVEETKKTMDALNETVEEKGKEISSTAQAAAKETADQTVQATRQQLQISDGKSYQFVNIGDAVSAGMRAGILQGKSGVINAAIEVSQAAYEASKAELDIHSPSRKFAYLGEQSAEGYSEGMLERLGAARGQVQSAMRGLLQEIPGTDAGWVDQGGQTAAGGERIGTLQVNIQPQTASREDLDNALDYAFDYFNERLGTDL